MPHRKLKLKKYLHEDKRYSATMGFYRRMSGLDNVILCNVCIGEKQYADHVWVNQTYRLSKYQEGTIIFFNATVKSYKSTKGETKYGLHKIHSVNPAEVEDQMISAEAGRQHKRKYQ